MIPQSKLKPEQFANWIDTATDHKGQLIDWQWWMTLTTGYSMSMGGARRAMNRFYTQLEDPGACFLWVAEPFDTKEGFHTHALAKTLKDFNGITKAWQIASGGKGQEVWHRIDLKRFNPTLGGSHYIGKYVGKRLSDFDIYTRKDIGMTLDRGKKDKYRSRPVEVSNMDSVIRDLEYSKPIIL